MADAKLLAAIKAEIDKSNSALYESIAKILGGTQADTPASDAGATAPTPAPVRELPVDVTVQAVKAKVITVTYNNLIVKDKTCIRVASGQSMNIVDVKPSSDLKTMDLTVDQEMSADSAKYVTGKTANVYARYASAPVTSPSTGGTVNPGDTPGSVSAPSAPTKVGTGSVAVFTNEDWNNGVWERTATAGVAMVSHPLVVPGAVLRFSDNTQATVSSVQVGSPNSSVWLDKKPDPAQIAKNNIVTIVSSPFNPDAAPVASAPAGGKSEIKARGALKSISKGKMRVNHGQAGGGDKLRQEKMDYGFATEKDIAACAAAGFEGVRISLLWERVLRTLDGEVDPVYGKQLLESLRWYGKYFGPASVLICQAHNYGGYSFTTSESNRVQLGTAQVPKGSLAKLTRKLAQYIVKDPEAAKAVYGIDFMNEPINLSSVNVIVEEYQLCIDELRKIPEANGWAAAVETYQWATTMNCADSIPLLLKLKDPQGRLEIHTHCYFDPDHGGDYAEADSLCPPVDFMKRAIELCKAAGVKHCFGEMGAPAAKRVGNANVETPVTLSRLAEGVYLALTSGSDVYAWWWSEYQSNDWDNVNSISAPRNAKALQVYQQFVKAA